MRILRIQKTENRTRGLLFDEEGKLFCYTLEPTKEMIPDGEYELGVRFSPKFKREVLWIMNVPEREYILFHSGNSENDSDGCVLVGYTSDLSGLPLRDSRICENDLLMKYHLALKIGKKIMVKVESL